MSRERRLEIYLDILNDLVEFADFRLWFDEKMDVDSSRYLLVKKLKGLYPGEKGLDDLTGEDFMLRLYDELEEE